MRLPGKLLSMSAVPAALVLGAAPASAHTDLVQGAPGPGAAVDTAVGDLSLTFSSALIGQGTQVVVRDPRGVDHATRSATLGPQTRVQLRPMTRPGTYSVVYRAVAGDGHPVTGHYSFRVTKQGAVAARGDSAAAAPDDDAAAEPGVSETGLEAAAGTGSSASRWVIGGLGAGCFAALLIAAARRRTESNEVPCA
jgi:methionine-rich copper-binding protein CopC